MATNRSRSKVLQNAEKAFKYSAVPVVTSKVPYMTGTAQSAISVAKDLRDWTIRNNPFRPVNGNKDPLIRQIATATSNAVKAAKLDLKSGDLTFSRLNKSVRDFVGDDSMFEDFDSLDIDFGTDYGEGLFSSDGKDDQTSGNTTASAMFAVGDNLSRTQAVTTEAMIGAVEHSTERITKTQMVMTDTAVTRLISSNMTIAARTASQLGTISNDIKVINNNLSLLVEQSNNMSSFINQSQRYMENTEQSLNDIKALLEASVGKKEDDSYGDNRDFMRGHFDFKKYINHVFNNTTTGMIASQIIGTTMKTLHMELPSFIDEMYAIPLTELNPLKTGIEKLIPAIGRLGDLDKTFQRSIEMFMSRLANGEYTGKLKLAGMEGFGRRTRRSEVYDSRGYEKGNIQWNGMAQRALMEVIPGYLSHMEGYLKQIAENTYMGKDAYALDQSSLRHYDYEYGRFENLNTIREQAKKDLTSSLQGHYDDFIRMAEKITDGSAEVDKELTNFMKKINAVEHEDTISKKEWLEEFKGIMNRHRGDKVSDDQILKAYDELIYGREQSIDTRNRIRRAASRRESSAFYLGDELNKLTPDLIFTSMKILEQQRYDAMTDAEKRQADKDKHDKEARKSFFEKTMSRLGLADDAKSIKEMFSRGGPLNKSVDFISDRLQGFLINLIYKGVPSYDVGSQNIPNDQVANVHKGEMIIPRDIADKIRAGQFDNKDVKKWLNLTAGSIDNNTAALTSIQGLLGGNARTKAKTRKAMGAMVEYADDHYKIAIDADAIKDGDLQGIWISMLENMANQTAIMAHNAERDANSDNKDKQSDLFTRVLGEKGEDGLYHGTMFSQYMNIGLDFKNAIRHAMYGEEYTTSEGVKIGKTDDTVMSTISKGIKQAGDTALSTIFGEDYKETRQFKKISKGYNELKAGITGKAQNEELTPEEERAVQEALQQTTDKGLELNKKLIGHVKGGLLGAIALGSVKFLGDGGVIPAVLGAGGPIGGALIGAGLSILTRNESFMDKMFGKMEDGERAGGIISKEMQERWKDLGGKLLGPAVIGAAGAHLFPKLTTLALGPVGTFMFGAGPIAGAALGIGTSLILKSQAVQDVLYGEEGKGGTTGVIGSLKTMRKEFWDKNKDKAGAMGLGGIAGALLGLKGASSLGLPALGVLGGVVGMSVLGATIGIKASSDRFQDFLFGTKRYKKDKNGNLVFDGRDGDGFIGKMSRKFVTYIITPARVFARSMSRDFAEWIRYDVGHQLKSAFEPFTLAIKEGVDGIADGMHAVTDKLMTLAKKITKPITSIVKGMAKLTGKTLMGGLRTGAAITGGIVSAPLKVLGHFGRKISRKYDPSIAANERKFRFGYRDADGKKHRGFWNPLRRLSDAKNAFLDSDGNFFDALAAGGHMLNPFTAYADAKYQYAEDTGYNNAAFLGGFFGAAGQKHRQIKKANRRKYKMESKMTKLVKEWKEADDHNDKITLTRKALGDRNRRLKALMGKEYSKVLDRFGNKSGSLSNDEMIQFMYDPLGNKKKEKDKQYSVANQTNIFLRDIREVLGETLLFVSGHKSPGSPLSAAVAKIGKALGGGKGSKGKKKTRKPGLVDESMYDFMKAAKGKGFKSIRDIASAAGIDPDVLMRFLGGERTALSGKRRRELFNMMGMKYVDTSSFGGKMKAAFSEKHALAKHIDYMRDHEYNAGQSKFVKTHLKGTNKYLRRAFRDMTDEERFKVMNEFMNGNGMGAAGLKMLEDKDRAMGKRKSINIFQGIGDKWNSVTGSLEAKYDNVKSKFNDFKSGVFDTFTNPVTKKILKRDALTRDERKFASENLTGEEMKGFKHMTSAQRKDLMNKYSSGEAGQDEAIRELKKHADAIKKSKADKKQARKDRKLSPKEKEFSQLHLSDEEKKAFKNMKPTDRSSIMKQWQSGNDSAAAGILRQEIMRREHAKAAKKSNRAGSMYTKTEKLTLNWIKRVVAITKDEKRTFPKAFRKMTHAERATITQYRLSGDITEAHAKLTTASANIETFGQKLKKGLGKVKEGASSIFGSLFSSKGGLMALGGTVIAGGLIFLFSKFPTIIEGVKDILGGLKDWFVDTAWPFIKDTVIPAAKKIFEGIGVAVTKVFEFLATGEDRGIVLENQWSTGVKKTKAQLDKESYVAAKHGLTESEVMIKSITEGGEAMMVDITGKVAGSQYTQHDALTATYVWLGNEWMLQNNPYLAPTVEELEKFAISGDYADAVPKHYKNICKSRGVKDWDKYKNVSSAAKKKAMQRAIDYLNGTYGTFRHIQRANLANQGLDYDQAAAAFNSNQSGSSESVGSGHFMQNDPRWANNRYANAGRGKFSTMGNGGCGPTALANAAMSQGIYTNPMAVANLSRNSGYAVGGGTSAGLFTNGARRLGLRSSAIGAGSIKRALSNGKSVVFAGKGNGLYTRAGHIMSARGLDSRGNVIVDDPLRRNSVSVPLSTLGRGMTHAWSIGRGDDVVVQKFSNGKELRITETQYIITDKDGNSKGYPKITSSLELSEAAKKMDLSKYSDYDIASLELKCIEGTAPIDINEFYFLTGLRNQGVSTSSRDFHMSLLGSDVQRIRDMAENDIMLYTQFNQKWGGKDLVYIGGETIGKSGCVTSSLGSMYANITGLNYRPDFITEQIYRPHAIGDYIPSHLDFMRSPSLKNTEVVHFTLNGHTHGESTNKTHIYPAYMQSHLLSYNTHFAGKTDFNQYTADEKAFLDFVRYHPFVIYGGKFKRPENDGWSSSGGTLYYRYSDTDADPKYYGNTAMDIFTDGNGDVRNRHAMMVVPVVSSMSEGGPTKNLFQVYDPGTSNSDRHGAVLTFDQLFNPYMGIRSIWGLRGNAAKVINMRGARHLEPTSEDLSWWEQKYAQTDLNSLYASSPAAVAANWDPSDDYNLGTASTEESSDEGFLSKLMKALSGLGEIALGLIGNLFGGKGDPFSTKQVIAASERKFTNNSTGSADMFADIPFDEGTRTFTTAKGRDIHVDAWSGYELWKLLDKGEITKDEYDTIIALKGYSGRPAVSSTGKTSAAILAQVRNDYPSHIIPAYSALPPWALESAGESKEAYLTSAPTSSKLSKDDIDNIVAASLTLSSYREGGFNGIANYYSGEKSYVDNDRYPAFGIDGFNGHYGHAQEVLRRMINSGALAPEDVAIAENLIAQCGVKHGSSNPFDASSLSALLQKYPTISQQAQAGYATQLMYNSTADVIKGYENGDLRSIEEMILMNHLSPYGPRFVEAMLGINPGEAYGTSGAETLAKIRNKSFSSDSLTNLAKAINDFHAVVRPSNNNGQTSWGSGHKRTLREAYQSLGGTAALGFGGGIADSFNTGSYDIVDTPVAINRTPRVEIDSAPVTSRLDVIITYLRQIANTARENRAGTAATNLDIGRGDAAMNQKLSNAGIQREERIPIYTETKNSDTLKQLHDRIARSPRPV